jgi:hypothetical protein
VFHRAVSLDEVPDGYRAMAGRDALKVRVRPSSTQGILAGAEFADDVAGPGPKRPPHTRSQGDQVK